jgi:acid phosphatase
VCGHYPIASGGPHPVSPVLENLLFPLFEKYGVDVYFSGHDHNAQVLQKHSVLCVVSGCASMVVPPPRPPPSTLFVSTVPGQFVTEVTATTLDLHYVEGIGRISFHHSLVKNDK